MFLRRCGHTDNTDHAPAKFAAGSLGLAGEALRAEEQRARLIERMVQVLRQIGAERTPAYGALGTWPSARGHARPRRPDRIRRLPRHRDPDSLLPGAAQHVDGDCLPAPLAATSMLLYGAPMPCELLLGPTRSYPRPSDACFLQLGLYGPGGCRGACHVTEKFARSRSALAVCGWRPEGSGSGRSANSCSFFIYTLSVDLTAYRKLGTPSRDEALPPLAQADSACRRRAAPSLLTRRPARRLVHAEPRLGTMKDAQAQLDRRLRRPQRTASPGPSRRGSRRGSPRWDDGAARRADSTRPRRRVSWTSSLTSASRSCP